VPELLVSVVVSTYNRPERLARLLAALRAQTLPWDAFEVVVIDNGSGPDTAALLEQESAAAGLQLRMARNEVTRGPAAGRNAGWRLARAPRIAFTDDDCAPSPDWLAEALELAASYPDAIVQGPTRPDPAELPREGLLSHTVRVERLGPQFETCNIFYPRRLLERLGGFDERFGLLPAGEDTDLAWRAIESGAPAVFAERAVVLHAVERVGVAGALRDAARWGSGLGVYAEHPQARAMLYRGIFWNVWHYLMWRSVLSLRGPAWLRRLVLARHLIELRRRAREHRAGAHAVPFLLLHDGVECWAVARGAIRSRTLVL
jgi:glycosyltransferase involved in cell wall biosynthesis